MKISDFISPAHVMLDVRASDKGHLWPGGSELGRDAKEVSDRIAKREELGSTGWGNGVALPQLKLYSNVSLCRRKP